MIQLPEDRRPPINPQLAVRVAVLGGVALVIFAILFLRLWFLQILSGEEYLAEANDNRAREIRVAAPRGDIVDRNGTTMVDSRVGIAVVIDPQDLPREGEPRAKLYRRLGRIIDMRPAKIRKEIIVQRKAVPYSTVTLRTDASRSMYTYIRERQPRFPGVDVDRVYLRRYPHSDVAAQLFGTVGEISPRELKFDRFRGVKQGTIVGKSGIEYSYDRYLRGREGARKVSVDAFGRPKPLTARDEAIRNPIQGKQLKLSLDYDLQKAGQEALEKVAPTGRAAFVAMDPRNGEVVGLGSVPSFDPNVFSKPVKPSTFKKLNSEKFGAPLYNRAIAGLYPTGSTFKLITSVAGLQTGTITPGTVLDDPGSVTIGNVRFQNAGGVANGAVALRKALQVSSDVFYYKVGAQLNGQSDEPLQKWARRLGIGRRTGIDLPGEFKGLLPTPKWRNNLFKRKQTDRPWTIGDNVNLAVGQGDLQATPLQMAVAYSTVANGGKVVRPHLGLEVEDSSGRSLQRIDPDPARKVKLREDGRRAILDGLRAAAGAPGGTSADVFKGFPHRVLGKTGTAERPGQEDQSWYVAYAPDARRPLVVAVTIERGGFGAEAAAPVTRLILSQWFGVKKKLVRGSSTTR
ncbi:MAG TPA: penicillin-binding protein 2 [Solirubrobacteraceae bacterium]|nr:penicillin-binding protein 2 [Solirubrobacteraceae bacterium]